VAGGDSGRAGRIVRVLVSFAVGLCLIVLRLAGIGSVK